MNCAQPEQRRCPCCGASGVTQEPVLWRELRDAWDLSPEEAAYIDRQQGERCIRCHSNLRSRVLAQAILQTLGVRGPLCTFLRSLRGRLLRILEINTAGNLPKFFAARSRHELRCYPDLDMMDMDLPCCRYDLVIHSDTLEHVSDPVRGLAECCRVLKPGGACIFTVPILVGRLTVSRDGKSPSYHGDKSAPMADMLVYTEYGADAWRQVLAAGFAECRIVALDAPAAHALVGLKSSSPRERA